MNARDGGFHLEDVLAGLDQEDVAAALDEGLGLLMEHDFQLVVGDRREHGIVRRRQHAGRSDGPRHEAGLFGGGEVISRLACELSRRGVELVEAIAQPVFFELEAVATEGIGFDDIRTSLEVTGMDSLDHVRPGEDEDVRASFLTAVILDGQVGGLNLSSHGPVVDENPTFEFLKVAADQFSSSYANASASPWAALRRVSALSRRSQGRSRSGRPK
ncbi:hypothetical protein D3C86_1195840 [compost metagenome]